MHACRTKGARTAVDDALALLRVAEGHAHRVHEPAQHVGCHLAVCARAYHDQWVPRRLQGAFATQCMLLCVHSILAIMKVHVPRCKADRIADCIVQASKRCNPMRRDPEAHPYHVHGPADGLVLRHRPPHLVSVVDHCLLLVNLVQSHAKGLRAWGAAEHEGAGTQNHATQHFSCSPSGRQCPRAARCAPRLNRQQVLHQCTPQQSSEGPQGVRRISESLYSPIQAHLVAPPLQRGRPHARMRMPCRHPAAVAQQNHCLEQLL